MRLDLDAEEPGAAERANMRDLQSLLGTELGGWRIERLLGRGAMGAVFEATRGAERAALKVILAGDAATEKDRQRFVREAKAVARIKSDHVCGSLGHGEDQGLQWLALEFVAGRDLQEVLKLRSSLTVDEALDFSRQVLLGLVHAHAAGVVHRDLKPANAILTSEGRVKLVDFGLARREDESMVLTAEGAVMGTPYYMPPEQIEGRVVDARADLYSLGHMIYQLFVGRPAYTGRTATQILKAHLTRTIPSVQEACPGAPAGLDRFLRKLTAQEVERRHQSAQEALEAFDALRARGGRKEPEEPDPDELDEEAAAAYAATHPGDVRAEPSARAAPPPDAGARSGSARQPAQPAPPPTRIQPAPVETSAAAKPPPPAQLPESPLGLVVGAVLALPAWVFAVKLGLTSPLERGGLAALAFVLGFELARRWARDRNLAAKLSRAVGVSVLTSRAEVQDRVEGAKFAGDQKARRLEDKGDLVGAAREHQERGDRKEAARLFEQAGRLADAAKVRGEMGQHLEAADLLGRAGDGLQAARLLAERVAELEARRGHEKNPRSLARLDEELARVVERASVLFKEQGQQREGAKLLSRVGRHRDAAELYLEVGAREEASQELIKAGDRGRAAELYERAGDVVAAARLTAPQLLAKGDKAGAARAFEDVGDLEQAARYYEESGQLERAADLQERLDKAGRAAELLERAGKHVRAAELFERAGDSFRAGRAYEQAERPDRALECYRAVAKASRDWGQAMRRIARLEERAPEVRASAPVTAEGGVTLQSAPRAPVAPTPPVAATPPVAPAATPSVAADAGPVDPRRWIGKEVDRYRIRDHLGSGAFADVFRAEHIHLERPVALKVLRPQVASRKELGERFLAEAKVVSRIRHPGVIEVYDFGRAEGLPFMALELVEGRPLRALIQEGAQPIDRVVALGKELCAALGAAHATGTIHRDLKPENVLVDREGHAHVLDFGMARVFWGTSRDEGAGFLGTPRYASPEAADNGDVTAAADQYALGLIIYELATGQLPFSSNSTIGWLHHHRSTPPAPPRKLRPDLPPSLEAALLKSLAKLPGARHPDLRAFALALGSSI